jgi:hypothetical protein
MEAFFEEVARLIGQDDIFRYWGSKAFCSKLYDNLARAFTKCMKYAHLEHGLDGFFGIPGPTTGKHF